MGLFKRDNDAGAESEPALSTLLLQGEDMIEQLARAHRSWGLGSADRWGLDLSTGLITWTFPDKTATAPAQIIATHNAAAASWLWAWANEGIRPELSRDSRAVRDWAIAHDQPALAQPQADADEAKAATLAALALRITRATGFYRGSGGASIPIITFGPVTLTAQDGTTSTFKIDIS